MKCQDIGIGHYGGCWIITSAPLRGAIQHPPQQTETTERKRRADKGNAAEPLGVCLCDPLVGVFPSMVVIGMLLCGGTIVSLFVLPQL